MADAGDPPDKEFLINYVCDETGTTRDVANFYLQAYAWKAENAVSAFIQNAVPEDPIPPLPLPLRMVTAEAENPPGAVQDPIDFFCECTGQCREAALFYLEGFKWNFEDAINGFHADILPPLGDSIPPDLLIDVEIAIDGTLGFDPQPPAPAPPPKRLRWPSSPWEQGSSTCPIQEHSSYFAEQDRKFGVALTSDASKVVRKAMTKLVSANTSHEKEARDGEIVDEEPSSIEISSAPTLESTLKIQLADGTEILAKFNPRDRIRDIRDYVDSMRFGEPKDYKLLAKGSPRRELTDMDQTIEEAGINNSSLIQEYPKGSTTPTTDEPSTAEADSPATGLVQDPSKEAITLEIQLRDGSELKLSLTYDKTIGDIYERIDEIRPEDSKAYHFLSVDGKEIRDKDQTIKEAALGMPRLVQMDGY